MILRLMPRAAGCWVFVFSLPSRIAALLLIGLCAIPFVASATCPKTATSDFDGTCKSDFLWRDGSGDVNIWFMNGATITSSADPGVVPDASWSIQGTGDFDGDGKTDILWRNANGDVNIWFMNGSTITSSGDPGVIPNSTWTIQGLGDFDGDGKTDILWRNSSGDVNIWFMNGSSIKSSADLGVIPNSWTIQGTGDFTGLGFSDILWRNSNGDLNIWFMNGATISSSVDYGVIPNSWTIQGTADFNGDGQADIIWRNSNGDVNIWFMNGATISSSVDPGVSPDPSWTILGTGDFAGVGQSDIVWRNVDGDVNVWFMNSATISSSVDLGVIPAGWNIEQSQPPYAVPAPAKGVGYFTNTFNTTTLGNTQGQLYFPAGFFEPGFGTITTNSDGSFTMTNGKNLPMVSTAHADRTKTNYWGGECFAGGGYYDVYASWTPFVGAGQPSWPQIGLYDIDSIANNSVGPWNVWGTEPITATATPTTGATSIAIPAWSGSSQATLSNVSITGTSGEFSGTFAGLYAGATITLSGTAGGTGSIGGYNGTPTTYYVSAANLTAQTFTLQTMGQAALTTTVGTLTGLTYTPGYSGTVTFSDSETRLASFTAGITNISWVQPLTGSSFTTALSVNWGANFVNQPEIDIVEADSTSVSVLGNAFFDWYSALFSQNKVHPKFSAITGVNTATPHHYAVLWVPGTASSQGYMNWYFDGTLYNTATWNQYNPSTPPAPTGTQVSSTLWMGGSALSVVDARCMVPVMSTAQDTDAPMTIYSVSVWQASSSSNQTQ